MDLIEKVLNKASFIVNLQDKCDCCFVCGQREGERCFNGSITVLPPQYKKYQACGDSMLCLLRTDVDLEDPPEAICSCEDATRVCGSDGTTYENICKLTEERYIRRDGLVVSSRSPCRHGELEYV